MFVRELFPESSLPLEDPANMKTGIERRHRVSFFFFNIVHIKFSNPRHIKRSKKKSTANIIIVNLYTYYIRKVIKSERTDNNICIKD